MKLKTNNTEINLKINKTENNIGIKKNDVWLEIKYYIKNNNIELEGKRELITNNELEELKNKINLFIKNNSNEKINISFIKNFLKISLYKENNNNIMKVKIIGNKEKNNIKEDIYLINDEINTLLETIK